MPDHSFDSVLETARAEITKGHWVCQKFTCTSCGQRLTIGEANVFYTHGTCDQCGAVTDIKATGCNYMLLMAGASPLTDLAKLGIAPPVNDGLTLKQTPAGRIHEQPDTKQ